MLPYFTSCRVGRHAALVTTAVAFVLGTPAIGGTADEHEAMLEFLLHGNRAQHELFPFLQARFEILKAGGDSVENALDGKWSSEPEPYACDVFWAFHGERFRRDELYSPDVIKRFERRHGSRVIPHLVNQSGVWNSTIQISWEPGQMFQVAPKGQIPLEGFNPFNCALNEILYKAADAHRRLPNGQVEYVGKRDLDGRTLPVIEMRSGDTHLQVHRCWIDPDQGFFPVRVETAYGLTSEASMVTVIKKFRRLDEQRCIPEHVIYVNLTSKPLRCIQFKLLEADATNPPADEAFSINAPEGTKGINRITRDLLLTKTGTVSLNAFASDGRLLPNQGDVTFYELPANVKVSSGVHEPLSSSGEGSIPVWPFSTPSGKRFGRPVILGVLLIAMVIVAIVLRGRIRRR